MRVRTIGSTAVWLYFRVSTANEAEICIGRECMRYYFACICNLETLVVLYAYTERKKKRKNTEKKVFTVRDYNCTMK